MNTSDKIKQARDAAITLQSEEAEAYVQAHRDRILDATRDVGRVNVSGLTKYWPTNTGEMDPDCGVSGDLYYKVEDVEALLPASPVAPVDPMDWPLPCDITVGAGTNKKGSKLRALVARMKMLHDVATKGLAAPAGEPVAFSAYELETARLAAAHYEKPDSDILALAHFERHRASQAKIPDMPGMSGAIPNFIAGFHAGRAAAPIDAGDDIPWPVDTDEQYAKRVQFFDAERERERLAAAAQAVVVPDGLRDEIVKLTCWKHCMSYNDSYFGEPAGLVKRVAYQLDRMLCASSMEQQAAPTAECPICAGTRTTFGRRCECAQENKP